MSNRQDAPGSPIRVILFSPKGSGLHYGGPGMTAYRMYENAKPGAFEITLVHGNENHDRYELFREQVRLGRLSLSPLAQIRFAKRTVAWLKRHAHEHEVFHGLQGFQVSVICAVAAQRLGVPAVIKLVAHQSDLSDKTGVRGLLGMPKKRRRMIREISGIIAISSAIADELRGYGVPESKIIQIPNGVDTMTFQPADSAEREAVRERLGWDERPVVLFSGVMDARKRPHLMVEALPLIRAKGLDCRMVFAGPFYQARYEAMFRECVTRCDPDGSVVLLGFVEDVASLYRGSDVFVLPSRTEGMPNALLEAMACGLPAVATRISGVTDLMEAGVYGRTVAATPEPAEIAEALIDYLEHPEERAAHGREARRRVVERYSARAVADAHEHLFRRLMAGGDAAP